MKTIATASFIYIAFIFVACKKSAPVFECIIPDVYPFEPYTMPVWHPNENLIGFNHSPLAGVSENGKAPCVWYMNSIKATL